MKNRLFILAITALMLVGCSRKQNTPTDPVDPPTPVDPPSPVEPGEYDVSKYYDGYYNSIVSWTDGEDLKNQLHNLIRSGFNGLTYDDQNWETNQYSEQSLDNFTMVDVVYSQTDFAKDDTYKLGNGWQREHAFCATLMTGYATSEAVAISSSGTSRATDFHNLFASYGAGNSARGNKNFGTADVTNLVTSAAPLADYKADTYNFEPNDCDKGELARAIFYMGVMYSEVEASNIKIKLNYEDNKTKTLAVTARYKPLTIQEEYVPYSKVTFKNFCLGTDEEFATLRNEYVGTSSILDISKIDNEGYTSTYAEGYADYSYENCDFAIGNLSTLLSWNNLAVSRKEMQHNESVYSHVYSYRGINQSNRNPFVDYPGLVDYVYGSKKDQAGQMKNIKPSEEDLKTGSNDLNNYAVTAYKTAYNVGDVWNKNDYSLVRVNKDFSTQEMDFTDQNPDYVFTSSDAGEKVMTIKTPINDIQYKVTVTNTTSGLASCDYIHSLTGVTGDFANYNDKNKPYSYADSENLLTFANDDSTKSPSTLDWYGYWANGRVAGYNADKGVTFGAQSSTTTNDPCETLRFTSKDDLTVNAVYILGNTGSGKSYDLKMYCDDQVIYESTFSYQSGPTEYGINLSEAVTGKIKIEFTSVDGTVVLKSIGVNVVE
ncbi:MAG: endonuclease [Bacilli bacterium]|nr:endonuclease [Bacilli bacterium]